MNVSQIRLPTVDCVKSSELGDRSQEIVQELSKRW